MARTATRRARRGALFLVALALCAGVGWQVGRVAEPGLPGSAVGTPLVSGGHNH